MCSCFCGRLLPHQFVFRPNEAKRCRPAKRPTSNTGRQISAALPSKGIAESFGAPSVDLMKGSWHVDDSLMIFTPEGTAARSKIAAFDLGPRAIGLEPLISDGTLILPKSGRVFPKDASDWRLMWAEIKPKLKQLHDAGEYKLVIFSNQGGMGKSVQPNDFKMKIRSILSMLGIPMQVFIATAFTAFRKPCTGMLDELMKNHNDGIEISLADSIYVGDAAGRHATQTREKKDHSMADRLFALNTGLKFYTPEQFFLGKKDEEPWGPISFNPKEYLNDVKGKNMLEPESALLTADAAEIIVLVGYPGSGKSRIARKLEKENGYAVVSRDTLGTWQKCVAAAKKYLLEGKSVVVDNTNPDAMSRERYISLAKCMKVQCRCFIMNTSFAMASHNVRYRFLHKNGDEISTTVLRMYSGKFEEPTLDEGFAEIVRVNLIPEFDSESEKELWSMFYNET